MGKAEEKRLILLLDDRYRKAFNATELEKLQNKCIVEEVLQEIAEINKRAGSPEDAKDGNRIQRAAYEAENMDSDIEYIRRWLEIYDSSIPVITAYQRGCDFFGDTGGLDKWNEHSKEEWREWMNSVEGEADAKRDAREIAAKQFNMTDADEIEEFASGYWDAFCKGICNAIENW